MSRASGSGFNRFPLSPRLSCNRAEVGSLRSALAEITGGMIVLDLDDSGRFFWAVFEDGIRAALLADAELMGVAYSDPSVFGKVESSGSGGLITDPATVIRLSLAA
jgi:hypothetical protein